MSTLRFNTWQNTGGTEVANSTLGTGKILQVVRATDSTSRITTSSTMVDAGISVTITPTSATSTIIVIWSSVFNSSGLMMGSITDSANNPLSGAEEFRAGAGVSGYNQQTTAVGYSAPATTSATTYKGRFRANSGTAQIRNDNVVTGQLYALEISA